MAAEYSSDSDPQQLPPDPQQVPENQTDPNSMEEMPEFEELTPELMEDECLRGDVMLRWALILLALLLGWTTITESSLLVNIRSGEYMLSHGILPPRVDVFSGTAEGRPWVNQAWLSDLLLGGLHRLLGMSALTVFCSLTVAAAFVCLSKVGVPHVSTWWGTCCSFLALIALFPLFQPGSSTLMILGLAVLMLCLSRESLLPPQAESLGTIHRFPWSLPYVPILFLLWANLDSRAWIGLLLLLLFMIGDSISRRLHRQPQSHRDWGVVLVTCLVAALLTPWPLQPLLGSLELFRERQALQTYSITSEFFPRLIYGMKDAMFWKTLDLYGAAAVLLAGISAFTLLLNARRMNLGWISVWLGMNLLSLFDGECICAAAMVNAGIATLNGQSWYRSRFSMEYSIDTLSVLWGRGGRAVMVLTFFLVAYLTINGAFMGPQGRRLGLGLDPRWTARIESLAQDVVHHSYSDRIFPTLISQGDALIWIGKKPFVDSRINLYLSGKENLLRTHQQVRAALFTASTPEKPVDQEVWKKTLSNFKTADVLVRLWGPLPPYGPMLHMLTSPAWTMTGLGAAGANFTRIDLPDEVLIAHARKYSAMQFSQQAFRPEEKPVVTQLQAIWPLPVSRYDRWLIQKVDIAPSSAELAAHYDQLLNALGPRLSLDQVSGLALLAVRNCREALNINPNHPLPYRVLARVYRVLQQIEQQVPQSMGSSPGTGTYNPQILAATQAAVLAGGDQSLDLQLLLETYLTQQQMDTSLQTLIRFENSLRNIPGGLISSERKNELDQLKDQLKQHVDEVRTQVDAGRAQGKDRSELISMALQGRCPVLAVSLIEEDLTELERSPETKLLYASLQMQTGNFETALQMLEGMESLMSSDQIPPQMQPMVAQWRNLTASANLATLDLPRAIELWEGEDQSIIRTALQSLLQMPFAAMSLPIQYELWPAYYARMATNAAIEVPEKLAQVQVRAALAELELGQLAKATQRLQTLLQTTPLCSQRFIAAFYLGQLTGRKIEVAPAQTPGDGDTPEPAAKQATEQPATVPSDATVSKEESKTEPKSTPPTDAPAKPALEPAGAGQIISNPMK